MTKNEELVWSTAVSHPEWGAREIAIMLSMSESEVAKILSKAGSAEPERVRLLKLGIGLTAGDRNKTYGEPYDNLDACAQLWSAYMSAKYSLPETFRMTAEDVGHLMSLVKMTRTFYGAYHPDNYVDSSTYQAIAGECRMLEERG
jgi:hypothetical protein